MSMQPHSEHDLDRTDELPRLDVAAYEARLAAEGEDALASTDAWSVEHFPDADGAPREDTTALRFPRTRVQPDPPKTTDVTLDATRILGRIQQLESELSAAKQRESEFQARIERLNAELATKEKETRGLSSDNARLTEQRSIAIERVRALEQQLKDEAAQYERDASQQRELRTAEQTAAAHARAALEQQITELTTLAAQLREDNSRLDDEAQAATKLARTQTEVIEQFKQRLTAEEKNSAQLARHLAAKIAEHAASAHEITRRDQTIYALTEARDDLAVLLDEARRRGDELSTQRAEQDRTITELTDTLSDRDATLMSRDERIAVLEMQLHTTEESVRALTSERDELARTLSAEREAQLQAQQALNARAEKIGQLQGSTEALQERVAILQQQLATEQSLHADKQNRILELQTALGESQLRRDLLASEAETSRTRILELETELATTESARQSLQVRTAELERTQEELATVQRELDELRTDLVTKHSEVAERDQALRTAQDVVVELRQAVSELESQAEQQRERIEELETRDRERDATVVTTAADLAAARRQLGQQLAAVQSMEQAIRARDTLTERLRAELQMSQDERAIISGQLEKSRARNKAMAREIFARDGQIATLKADLAVHVETLAAIRQDVNRAAAMQEEHPDRILEPVDHDGEIIELRKKMMTIGRTSENDICIPSKLVSRNHARLLIGPNAVIIEDAGSTNGCLVNDMPVKQQVMREGDILSIGDLKYRLRTRGDHTRGRDNVIPFG